MEKRQNAKTPKRQNGPLEESWSIPKASQSDSRTGFRELHDRLHCSCWFNLFFLPRVAFAVYGADGYLCASYVQGLQTPSANAVFPNFSRI